MSKKVLLREVLCSHASSLHLNLDVSREFQHAVAFFEENGWFGLSTEGKGTEICLMDPPESFPRLDLWLKSCGLGTKEKLALLQETFRSDLPAFMNRWMAFVSRQNPGDAHLVCLDFFLSVLSGDPEVFTEDLVSDILSKAEEVLSSASMEVLLRFFESQDETDPGVSFRVLRRCTRLIEAWPLSTFSRMAELVLSQAAVSEGRYIEKAAEDAGNAELWLFVALHFVCAVRIPDLQLLPVPKPSMTGKELRESILNGKFSIEDAVEFVNAWICLMELRPATPKKTRHTHGVPNVIVSIPEDLKPLFGTILALVCSFHEEEAPLLRRRYATSVELEAFFGKEFVSLNGGAFFLRTMKLNKSYLQGVQEIADDSGPVRLQGTLLASLLRGHKLRPGELSATTEHYLRDCSFTGKTPALVAEEMFERGIFGFVPVLLLNRASGNAFRVLDLHRQTLLIQEIGLSSTQLEKVTEGTCQAMKAIYAQLTEILGKGFTEESLRELLVRVARDAVPGKNPLCLCLRRCAGLPCTQQDRDTCLGCGCEMWTRTGIHLLMSEYKRNMTRMDGTGAMERLRLGELNNRIILPAIQGILVSLDTVYDGHARAESLKTYIRRRLQNVQAGNA